MRNSTNIVKISSRVCVYLNATISVNIYIYIFFILKKRHWLSHILPWALLKIEVIWCDLTNSICTGQHKSHVYSRLGTEAQVIKCSSKKVTWLVLYDWNQFIMFVPSHVFVVCWFIVFMFVVAVSNCDVFILLVWWDTGDWMFIIRYSPPFYNWLRPYPLHISLSFLLVLDSNKNT